MLNLHKYKEDKIFLNKVKPYIEDPAFIQLLDTQHHNDSIYTHILRVAYTAYRIGNRVHCDRESLLRGALFHDLYFHDWRDKKFLLNHGWVHPKIALENAKKLFPPINRTEANIIESHMWPFNITKFPKCKEALIVSVADKWVATFEVIGMGLNLFKKKNKG